MGEISWTKEQYSILRLGEVLAGLRSQPSEYKGLFVSTEEPLDANSESTVVSLDEFNADRDIERVEQETGFAFVLDMDQVFDIVTNAREQEPAVSSDQLVEALSYYYHSDAFIEFE